MINSHVPVMLDQVKSFIPTSRDLNLIDATFGGGGYSKAILEEFNIKNLLAIDRDPTAKIFYNKLKKRFKNIELFNEKFSKIDEIIKTGILSKAFEISEDPKVKAITELTKIPEIGKKIAFSFHFAGAQ